MDFINTPRRVPVSQVPTHILRGIIAYGLGNIPPAQLYDEMTRWALRRGGDVIIEFSSKEQMITPTGHRLTRMRFVAPR